MLPSRYRGRYSLFIILSLLMHLGVIVVLLWSTSKEQPEKMQDKTVTVTLKQKEEPKKEEPKKEEPKKEEAKKEEAKKEEAKKEEAKKEEAKKAEPKKVEPKKVEPKKVEAKKAEPKKVEAKKVEAKKVEAKKVDAKKAEPKKVEPKKVEPKKVEPKKVEPKKVEPKKVEPKKVEAKKAEPYHVIRDSLSEYSHEPSQEKQQTASMRPGSMEILDERTMSQLVVSTQSLDRKFDTRHFEGEVIKQELNFFQKQKFNAAMQQAFSEVAVNIVPVAWDGGSYYGEINFFVDIDGTIEKIVVKKSSGSEILDNSMIEALIKTKRISMPDDPKIRRVMHLTKKLLYYSDKDMLR